MAYIGKEPIVGNFQVCDAISVVNGQAAYTMQVSSTNVVPESVNHMLVSLNGILQKPGSSFTISGSTITFASNLATGDVIDFIMLLGNVLDLGVPSDATVTDAKANFVSTSSAAGLQIKGDGTTDGTLALNCSQNSHAVKIASPAHSAGQAYKLILPTENVTADKFLKVASVSGSGTTGIGQLSFADAGGNNTPSFSAVKNANQDLSDAVTSKITFETEEFDTDSAFASSRFTVPSGKAGKYLISSSLYFTHTSANSLYTINNYIYKNGSPVKQDNDYLNYGFTVQTMQVVTILDLAESDYIEIYGASNSNGNTPKVEQNNATFFQGFKLL